MKLPKYPDEHEIFADRNLENTLRDRLFKLKNKQCDFILYTNVTSMKSSAAKKIFGRVAGVGGVDKTEAKIEFKLFAIDGSPRLQAAATAKEEGDDASAGKAVSDEARAVIAELKRR